MVCIVKCIIILTLSLSHTHTHIKDEYQRLSYAFSTLDEMSIQTLVSDSVTIATIDVTRLFQDRNMKIYQLTIYILWPLAV